MSELVPPISPEMQQQLNVPTDLDKVPQFVDSADHADPRQQTLDKMDTIDQHLQNDNYADYLNPDEAKQVQQHQQKSPNDAYLHQMVDTVHGRIVQKVVPPMPPEQWEALRQYAGDATLKNVAPEHLAKVGGDVVRKIGTDSFDNLYGKHQKYLVQQPKGDPNTPENEAALKSMPLVAPGSAEGASKGSGPKAVKGGSGPSSQFANSLLDIVRGAGQVSDQQKKTGRQVNDELFAKILAGRGQ